MGLVEHEATVRLLDLYESMIATAEAHPFKWDEDGPEHAVDHCIDRLFCCDVVDSFLLVERYRALAARARPFHEEGVPLPGSVEARAVEIAERLYHERWPEAEVGLGGLPYEDPVRVAIEREALRDAQAERNVPA
jgi:hypothetical protein